MTVSQKNTNQILRIMNALILLHIPLFYGMAEFFSTQKSIAIFAPLALLFGQLVVEKVFKHKDAAAILMGFTMMALSAIMIHLGKGMIEWHFHIFVLIGVLCLFANPFTIVAAAIAAAVHHVTFYFFLPESIFNYEASFGIVVIHALFVVFETVACVYLSTRFKNVLSLQEKINQDISPLVASIDEVSKSSKDSCADLLSYTEINNSNITEISATAEEISRMVESTKHEIEKCLSNMEQTNSSINSSSSSLKKGEDFLNELGKIKNNMERIEKESSEKLSSVQDSVNTISDKTSIINDIVFQTKLLSFNASVEAARSGEHGKGFAVVAQEIGTLATTSGTASEEINLIVQESRTQLESFIGDISQNMSSIQKEIHHAFEIWNEVNSQIQTSFNSVKESTSLQDHSLKEITNAAEQQSDGIRELSSALNEIDSSSNKSYEKLREIDTLACRLGEDSKNLYLLNNDIKEDDKKAS